MWFLNRFRLTCLISSRTIFTMYIYIYTIFFLRILLVKVVFSNHHFQISLFRADFQKERGFWVDLGLISSKTMFLLRILLVKVDFTNHFLKSPFSNLTFQGRFPKRTWFRNRFRLNLLKNHVPFENSAREGGFLKSLSQITIFKSDFSEPISKKNLVFQWI